MRLIFSARQSTWILYDHPRFDLSFPFWFVYQVYSIRPTYIYTDLFSSSPHLTKTKPAIRFSTWITFAPPHLIFRCSIIRFFAMLQHSLLLLLLSEHIYTAHSLAAFCGNFWKFRCPGWHANIMICTGTYIHLYNIFDSSHLFVANSCFSIPPPLNWINWQHKFELVFVSRLVGFAV